MGDAFALGFSNLTVQSGLGQQLRAQLEMTGNDAAEIESSCFKAKVETPDGSLLATVNIALMQSGRTRFLSLATRKDLLEPAVKILVDIGCEIQLRREFLILLDPPQFAPTLALPQTSKASPVTGKEPATSDQITLPPGPKTRARKQKPHAEMTEVVNSSGESTVSKKKSLKSTGQNLKSDTGITHVRDRLKLSDDVPVLSQDLRLSDQLSVNFRPSNMEELRAAQAQLAVMLRDEKSVVNFAANSINEEQRILGLQQEIQQLKHQNQLDKTAMEEARESSFSRNWMIGLSMFVLAGLAIIGFLLLYMNNMRKKLHAAWWEQKEAAPEPEVKRNIEEIVDDIQASYGPTTTGSLYQIADDEPLDVKSKSASVKRSEPEVLGKLEEPSMFNKAYMPTLEDSNSSTFNFFSSRGHSVKVEEISDVTQEAEFWISVNDPQRAIEILEHQKELDQPESPVPWLYLLDLYRVTGNKEKYDALRDRFVVFFNANIPEFEVDPASLPTRSLEDFEHLMTRICRLWNTNDILPLLQGLLVDDRDGKRMGFELPVYRDILLLISVANELEKMSTYSGSKSARAWGQDDKPEASDIDIDTNVIHFENIDFPKEK